MRKDEIPTFEAMIKATKRNPLRGLQLARQANATVNQMKYEIAAVACGVARFLIENEEHRDDFYDEEFWETRQRFHLDKLLLHVFMYLYEVPHSRSLGYSRASEHSRALQSVCDDHEIDVSDIPAYIADRGGFDGLIEEKAKVEDDSDAEHPTGEEPSSNKGRPAAVGIATKPRTATRAIGNSAIAVDRGRHSNDGDNTDDAEENDNVSVPVRKASPPEKAKPSFSLLSRDYIALCVLVRPADAAVRDKVLQAIRDGKTVNADLVPGKRSSEFELYRGGRGFIEVMMNDFVIA